MRRQNSPASQKLARLLILVLAFCSIVGSQGASYGLAGSKLRAQKQGAVPRYEDFPVTKIYKGKPAPPVLSSTEARTFRTRLKEGAAKGPNFAGHYTIVGWGCGSSCQQLAVIDAQTGKVYFSKTLPNAVYAMLPDTEEEPGLKYRLNSKLLVLVGWPGEGDQPDDLAGIFYYKWENNEFKLVHAVKKKR